MARFDMPVDRRGVRTHPLLLCWLWLCVLPGAVVFAQQASRSGHGIRDYEVAGSPVSSAAVDRQIAAALKEVSGEKIRANIEALVGFKNRSTVSSLETDLPPGTGVLAASDWIRQQLESYSKACGNCLEVKVDAFVEQPPTGVAAARMRIVKPTPIRNVYAILRGSRARRERRFQRHRGQPGIGTDSEQVQVSRDPGLRLRGGRRTGT
jgi:hypothetical protein